MRKRGYVISIIIVFAILMANFSIAATNESEVVSVDKAYKCLNEQIKKVGSNIGFQDAIFAQLAIGSVKETREKIESEKSSTENCWPKAGCKIKETAQVMLAYDRVGKSTSEIRKWLMSKNASASELIWFLEIDITNKEVSTCSLKYDGVQYSIKVNEEQKISGNAGNCFVIANNGYMLRVSNNCIGKEFEISCDKDFVTAMIYQSSTGKTLFIPPKATGASGGGTTKEKAISQCFKTTGAGCDYEGTLWAVLALEKLGEETDAFLPYLYAFADSNKRYFPSAFLYMITSGEDQYDSIISLQKQGKYWEIAGSPYNKYYDSALALMALSKTTSQEAENAKANLLTIQTPDGCWNNNNIRDSGFILYAGFTKSVGREGGGEVPKCTAPFSCTGLFDCEKAGGTRQYNYDCSSEGATKICCSISVVEETCSKKGGVLCGANEQCTGRTEPSKDGSCCMSGFCEEIPVVEDLCSKAGGTCKFVCEEGEEKSSETCANTEEVCCVKKGTSIWFWIVLLIILIALTIVGIVYRNQLRLFWFKIWPKIKEKFMGKKVESKAMPTTQPTTKAPIMTPQRMMPRPAYPISQRSPGIAKSSKEKEIEETLRKLKEMGK
ncbi:MAG: hypothetical protein N3D20_00190 [Candidatus Pacearchaeota archaeon]|nr:hypothetical protein [Candidatus Pacearchaeota archaeon]